MNKRIAMLLVLCMAVALTACGGNGTSTASTTASAATEGSEETAAASTEEKNTLTVKIGPISDYDVAYNYSSDQWAFMNAVYATLIDRVQEDGEAVCKGDLAEEWEITEENEVIFHLAESATFSDGSPITSEDVIYSFEIAMESPYLSSYTTMIQSLEAQDDHTVVVSMTGYDNTVPWIWSNIYIVDEDAYAADIAAYSKNPNASGAYTIESIDEATGNMVLKARDDYWGDAPSMETINLRVINDTDSAAIALESGEVDLMIAYSENVDILSANDNLVLEVQGNNSAGGLYLNCSVSPWDNAAVRQAAAYAMDYAAVANVMFSGYAEGDPGIAFNSVIDKLPEGLTEYSYNVEEAQRILEEAGIETPIEGGTIIGGSAGEGELIQQYLAAVGINVTVLDLGGNDYVNALISGDYYLAVVPSGSSAINGAAMLANVYASAGAVNYACYSNAELDSMIEELQTIKEEDAYQALLTECLEIVAQEIPIISFGSIQTYAAHTQGLYVPVGYAGELFLQDCHW